MKKLLNFFHFLIIFLIVPYTLNAKDDDYLYTSEVGAGHGLFSYYLMKGLEGNADINADNEITSKELFSFISDNVSDRALDIGISQNPSLIGDSDNIIVRW